MNNFLQRALLFIIGLPLLIFIVVFFDRYHQLGWSTLIVVTTWLGTRESLRLFVPEPKSWERRLIPLAALLISISSVFDYLFSPALELLPLIFLLSIFFLLILRLFAWETEEAAHFTSRSSGLIAALIYPALFMAYLIRFAEFSAPLPVIILFLILNFGNDTSAYLAGRFFGANSPRLFAVSPKKTLVGFLGGFAGALLLASLFTLFHPELFSVPWSIRIPFFLLTALVADIGDLVESALKRGAEKKDSGRIIPGRGGMLDSIDSLLFSAPIFYYIGLTIFI